MFIVVFSLLAIKILFHIKSQKNVFKVFGNKIKARNDALNSQGFYSSLNSKTCIINKRLTLLLTKFKF